MPSLSANFKIGNASASSLIKTAGTVQRQIAANQDEMAKITWENSAKDDAAFQVYSNYLQGRVNSLNATGTIADSTKALTMNQDIINATHQNMSYHIQAENQQLMMSGDYGTSYGYAQKMQVVKDQYNRALAIGDQNLAFQLQGQYLSLNQSYQSALQTEATAAQTKAAADVAAASASETATKSGYNDAISGIKNGLENLLANIKSGATGKDGKPGDVNTQLNDFRNSYNDTYKAITGQDLPKGTQLTLGSIVEAAFTAEYNYNINAAQALGSDPATAAKYAQFDQNGNVIGGAALKVLNNTAYYNVPGLGNINAKDAYALAHDPNAVREVTIPTAEGAKTEFRWNAVIGYQMSPDGIPYAIHSAEDKVQNIDQTGAMGKLQGVAGTQNSQRIIGELVKAGFGDVKYNKSTGEFTTKLTAQTEHWLNVHGMNPDLSAGNGQLGAGNEITWRWDSTTNSLSAITSGNRLVHFSTDVGGRSGVFQTTSDGKLINIAGQYGFNQHVNTLISEAMTTQALVAKENEAKAAAAAATARANAQRLVSGATNPLPGSFAAVHPNAGGLQPSHYIGPQVNMAQRVGGGFNFTQNGQSISAARYAQLTNTPFRSLLQTMANRGDQGARTALGFVGNDYGYDPSKISGNSGLYNSLVWGAHSLAGSATPASATAPTGATGSFNIGGLSVR